MNEKFFTLPIEKQQRILNAGYRVFSQNSYKKSPVGEIASEAGISKSLLFHYFRNKKELYFFLWDEATKLTMQYLTEYRCYEPTDLFEMMRRGMKAKLALTALYPDLTMFVMKAFYEKEPEIAVEIQKSYQNVRGQSIRSSFEKLNPADFRDGLDLEMMHQEMYWASAGYLWEIIQRQEPLDIAKLEADFTKLLEFWKKIYGKDQGKDETR